MAPGLLASESITNTAESRPSKKLKTSTEPNFQNDDEDVATALPSHPLGIKPAGNALTASENIKSRCGSFARLPDELLSHILESFDADTLIRLGSTCRALYAFTRLDELWRALFVRYVPELATVFGPTMFRLFPTIIISGHRPHVIKELSRPESFCVQGVNQLRFCVGSHSRVRGAAKACTSVTHSETLNGLGLCAHLLTDAS
jgi:hypothetical protein